MPPKRKTPKESKETKKPSPAVGASSKSQKTTVGTATKAQKKTSVGASTRSQEKTKVGSSTTDQEKTAQPPEKLVRVTQSKAPSRRPRDKEVIKKSAEGLTADSPTGSPAAKKSQEAAMSIDKSDLKAELERKKQRLAQIREEKKRKEEERKKKETELLLPTEPVQEDTDLDRKRRETEALLQSIGISPEPPLVPTPMSPSSKSVSTPSEAGSQDSGDIGPMGS